MSDAFCFVYADLFAGGIQTYLLEASLGQKALNNEIVWLLQGNKASYSEGLSDFVSDIIVLKRNQQINGIRQIINNHDRVVIITFSYVASERIRMIVSRLDHKDAKVIYIIPHISGRYFYPDLNFKSPSIKKLINRSLKKVFECYITDNDLYYFSKEHQTSFENHYNLRMPEYDNYIAPSVRNIPLLDVDIIKKRYNREVFQIVTMSRFEFPHKGYVLGLIDITPQIQEMIPNYRLTIIGTGNDLGQVKKHIDILPDESKSKIEVVGDVSYFQIKDYFENANMAICLAGAVYDAAKYSVPTLIARHYCNDCEVYGFYSSNQPNGIYLEPGNSPLEYIKSIWTMTLTEYIQICKDSHKCAKQQFSDNDANWFFKIEPNKSQLNMSFKRKLLYYVIKYRQHMNNIGYRVSILLTDPKLFFKKVKRAFIR